MSREEFVETLKSEMRRRPTQTVWLERIYAELRPNDGGPAEPVAPRSNELPARHRYPLRRGRCRRFNRRAAP